jgi:hypothetical protein
MSEKIEVRNDRGQLQKGSNLNPSGMDRRRALMLRKLESLTPRALAALERLVDDEANPTVRLGAAREILDRTMGKAKQSVTVDVTSSGALHLQALQELADRARIAEARTIDVTPLVSDITVHVMKD